MNDRPHVAGIIQNKQKCLIFTEIPQAAEKRMEEWLGVKKNH